MRIILQLLWNQWLKELKSIANVYAPLCDIRVKNRNNPLFNDAIQQAIYARNYYHAKLIKCKDSVVLVMNIENLETM